MTALAPRPVIDAEHPRFGGRLRGVLAQAAQQGRRADRHARPAGQPRSRMGAQRQGDRLVKDTKTLGMAGSRTSNVKQIFSERSSRAGVVGAAKASDFDEEDDRAPETRHIAQTAPVMAVNSVRFGSAVRAKS